LILGALIAKLAPLQDQILPRVGLLLFGLLLVGSGIAWLQHSRSYVGAMSQAHELLDDSKTTDAIAKLNAVIRQRPDYWPAHLQLARAYTIQRDYPKAESELKRVIQLNPGNEGAYYYLGYTELERRQPDQARAAFTQLLKMNPINPDGHAGLAAVLSSEGKYSEALEEYKRTAQLAPDYQNVFYDMGLAQSKLGLYDDAIQSFLKQRENGDDPDNESALASVYETKGMSKEASDASQRALQFADKK
jgi:tetratricopeptide (TPR) repeat protein